MKNIFVKGAIGLLCVGTLGACSEDYLQVAPITSISKETVTATVDAAEMAIHGLAWFMKCQYSNTNGSLFFNGEGTIMSFYGEGLGQDDWYQLTATRYGLNYQSLQNNTQPGYWCPSAPWTYGYGIITQCNDVLAGIDTAEGTAEMRNFVKAQALTMRAHGYWRLLQFYAPRWEDSRNGEIKCVVRRDGTPETMAQEAPLMSMNDALDLIYSDLDQAIELYGQSGDTKRQYITDPDLSIAYGTYARAALLKHDWAKVKEMANKARQGYEIMSWDQYRQGFNDWNNPEWMWGSSMLDEDSIYYWDNMAFYGANGAYVWFWGVIGAGAINMDLYRQMDEKDWRRDLFLTPDKISNIKEKDWFDAKNIDISNMGLKFSGRTAQRAISSWCKENTPEGLNTAYAAPEGETAENGVMIPFGAHVKFFAKNGDLGGSTLYMRASEMLLMEAEAAAELGETATAKALLEELNAKRMESYTCTATGQALIEEVRLYRRIELWGEGFNWFDLKRWNLPIVRNSWVEGDLASGNIPKASAGTVPATARGWRMALPESETNYNKMCVRSEYEY